MDDNSASLASVFSAIRALLITLGSLLAANGYGNSGLYKWVEIAAGAIMVIGPAAWGVWNAVMTYRNRQKAQTAGVNAGMALAASGHMLVHDDGSPVAASTESAKAIVQTFATEPAKAA